MPTLDRSTAADGGAVVDGEIVVDASTIVDSALSLAGALSARGVGPGDVVCWQLPNWHEAIVLFRACWQLGAIAAPVQHKLGPADVAPLIELLEPRLSFSAPDLALSRLPGTVLVRGDGGIFERFVEEPPVDQAPVRGADIAVAAMTSGSTGQAKVVLLSHRALSYKVRVQQAVHGLSRRDVLLTAAPFSHVSGLLNGVLLSGVAGLKVVLMEAWEPNRALDLIDQHAVTYMGGPAVFLTSLTESPTFDPGRVASLRVCSIGGSAMTPAALERLADRLGCVVKRSYGLTEAATVATSHPGDPPVMGRETDGRTVGEVEIVIVDPADGTRRAAGEPGEIWVRGPEMFSGYAIASQTDDAVADGGWLRTGDLGVLDAEGWLRIVGRMKELIIRGGENVASAEIEALLEAHPSVRQAVAVGYPDAVLGERVAGVVVADSTFDLDACRRWFAEQGVAKFKTPEAIVHVDEIPLTHSEKPDRQAIKAHVATLLAAGGLHAR